MYERLEYFITTTRASSQDPWRSCHCTLVTVHLYAFTKCANKLSPPDGSATLIAHKNALSTRDKIQLSEYLLLSVNWSILQFQ